MKNRDLERNRDFLKGSLGRILDFSTTDQNMGIPVPPVEKPCSPDDRIIPLTKPGKWKNIGSIAIEEAIAARKSVRRYSPHPVTKDELSFLLWATQGVRSKVINGHAFRTVPSAGCRHALETYLAIFRVDGIEKGIYRYLPLSHGMVYLSGRRDLESAVIDSALGQRFAAEGAVTFLWTAIPYRMEWRYGLAAHKLIAMDAGHVCQNLYLACASVGAGTCAIAAYDQEKADELVGADGKEEFVIYMAAAGKTS